MKNLIKSVMLLSILLIGMASAYAADVAVNMDEAKLKEFILKVIKDNPKLIYDAVNDYVRDQQKAREVQEFEESFKKRANDTVAENVPIKGNEKAQITIIEYSDFQCPYCSRGAELMKEVLGRYPDKVKIAFKNNPLNFHNMALPAAKAALAAHKQGKFWEYHDLLFQNSAKLSEELFPKFAQDLKLDMTKFEADRKSEEVTKQVDAEMNKAKELGLNGTPSFVVNGVIIRGTKGLDYFAKIIDRLLAEPEKK
jgi:protein-disulfide isomerase